VTFTIESDARIQHRHRRHHNPEAGKKKAAKRIGIGAQWRSSRRLDRRQKARWSAQAQAQRRSSLSRSQEAPIPPPPSPPVIEKTAKHQAAHLKIQRPRPGFKKS